MSTLSILSLMELIPEMMNSRSEAIPEEEEKKTKKKPRL
jgi:hypothetical protein